MSSNKNKKNQGRRREQSPLSRVLASSNNQGKVLENFFSNLNPHVIRGSVQSIAKHRHFAKAVALTKDHISDCYSVMTPRATLEKNVAWCLGLVEYHAASIQFFLEHQDILLKNILQKDFEAALSELELIDDTCGISTWTIAMRGSILSMSGQGDRKRHMLTELNGKAGDNPFFKAVIRRIIERYDYGDTVSTESKFFEQKIKRQFEGETLHFLMYKLIENNFEFEYDYQHIINIEKNGAAIDIYQCLYDFSCNSKMADVSPEHKLEAIKVTKSLSRIFSDEGLQVLAKSFGIDVQLKFNETEFDVLDKYTAGDYAGVCGVMEKNPSLAYNFSLYELWAKSLCRHEGALPENLLGELLKAMSSLMLKDENAEAALQFLSSYTHALSTMPWFRQLRYLTILETKFISSRKNLALKEANVVLSNLNSPLKARYLPKSDQNSYMEALTERFPASQSVSLFKALLSDDEALLSDVDLNYVDSLRRKKYRAEWYLERGLFSQAFNDLDQIRNSSDVVICHDVTRLLVTTYIALEKIEDAIDIYVRAVIKNPSLLRTFDSETICAVSEKVISSSASISIPIALSWHSRFFNGDYDAALKFSFECFLSNNKVKSPLDLIKTAGLPPEQFNYFLEHVCVPEVMKLYFYFEFSKDIENCRISICKHLVQIGVSAEAMIYEIKERTRRLVILDAIKHVENSRIYSDTSSFTLPGATEYRQLFDRFTNLRSNDYSQEVDEIALAKILQTLGGETFILDHLHRLHVQDLVLNEKNAIFMKLIKLMRDEFTFGAKGLNGHLSTRIRHGYFPNTLRKCLSDERLVTAKLTTSGTYKKNSEWIDYFSQAYRGDPTDLEKAFSEFSSRYDHLINDVNDQWLKVGTLDQDISGLMEGKVKQEALFNYSVTALESYYVQSLLTYNADYNDLVKVVTNWLWERTEVNLGVIRTRINSEIREKVFDLLNKLETDVYSIVNDPQKIAHFSDAVGRARGRLSFAFDTVVGWFARSKEFSITSFESYIPVEIARLSAGAELALFSDTTGIKFEGKTLSYFVDILYVLLENCISKSNLSSHEVQIQVSLTLDDDALVLQVVNNCAKIDDLQKADENLQHYREKYGREEFALQASQGEGRSGLFKVWKALEKDLELSHYITFGYEDATAFKVSISINKSELEKIRHHENSDH